jgi:hypothetical protein
MSWTYSGDPSTSPLDEVRFLSGDTEELYSFVSDEEMTYHITKAPTLRDAAIRACRSILRKLAKQVDYTIGPESVKASQRLEQYKGILADLLADTTHGTPSWDASIMDVPGCPIFDIGMHDNKEG